MGRTRLQTISWLLFGSVIALAVSGCASSEEEQDPVGLDAFVAGGGFETAEEAAARELKTALEAQESIRSCMTAEGFDYIPFVPPGVDDPIQVTGLEPPEFASEYGFGLATGVRDGGAPFAVAQQLPEVDDPNAEIVAEMTPAERHEYYRRLYGEGVAVDSQTGMLTDPAAAVIWAEPESCYVRAQELAHGSETFWIEFGADWNDIVDRATADPRVIALRSEWAECMANEGHRFADQQAMLGYVLSRLDEVVTYPSGPASALIFAQPVPGAEPMIPEFDEAELATLIDEEIDLASTSLQCSEGHDAIRAEVFAEYEQAFVEDNMERLLPYRRNEQ